MWPPCSYPIRTVGFFLLWITEEDERQGMNLSRPDMLRDLLWWYVQENETGIT